MAEYDHKLTSDTIRVIVPSHKMHGRNGLMLNEDIALWLCDETRAGSWSVVMALPRNLKLAIFRFTDDNTAFEFKMRWG